MRQRVVIAIALARNPKLIIADEPTTALDVTIQKQILNLLRELSRRKGISILLITHDLAVVSQYADRVVVMYSGKLMEAGSTNQVLAEPQHPYTRGLIRSIPSYTEKKDVPLYVIPGSISAPSAKGPQGCVFGLRCETRGERCLFEAPPFSAVRDGREIACWKAIGKSREEGHG
jgi:oligopeptide/dipeptide ABC transporter ATP-binding protein